MFTAVDEQLHEPSGDPHWQESYYFNWAEPDGRSFGLTRIGYNHHERKVDGLLLTMRDGRPEFIYPAVGLDMVGAPLGLPAEFGLRAGGLTYTMREPFSRWHIGLSGKHKVDLRWTAFNPVYDFKDGYRAMGASEEELALAPAHFEQCGEVHGTLDLGHGEREIHGFGHRDKSWGLREWNAIKGWEWLSAQFGEEFAFNATLANADGREIPGGFVALRGENIPVVAVQVDYEWTSLKHVPRSAVITFQDIEGREYVVTAQTLAQFPLPKKGLFIQESHSTFQVELDGRVLHGVGVLEHAWHAGTRGTLERAHQFLPIIPLALKQRFA